ncbi:MAG TPA: alpha-L-rhamnosidase C-terminal domain-containing protein, partial [Chryseosolibacter sp.]
ASFESVYGEIVSGWELKDGNLRVQVTIPANSSAVVRLPGTTAAQVSYKGGSLASPGTAFTNVRDENGDAVFEAGSGRHEFSYRYGGM